MEAGADSVYEEREEATNSCVTTYLHELVSEVDTD